MKSSINYEPRGDRVVVKRLEPPAPKEGEVIMPKSQAKQLDEGIVVAVGPGLRNRLTWQVDPVDLQVGDHVCFGDYAGSDVEVDGVKYLSMRDEEIHGRRPAANRVGVADPKPCPHCGEMDFHKAGCAIFMHRTL